LVLVVKPVTVPCNDCRVLELKAFFAEALAATFSSALGRLATRSPMANLNFIFFGVGVSV